MDKKVISVVIPTYNEIENIDHAYERIKNIFNHNLSNYNYEILFIDNCSTDGSRDKIKEIAAVDTNVIAIFNVKNFGFTRSTFHGLVSSRGDCSILMFADMQDPPEYIPDFVKLWEQGNKIVCGIKKDSKENKLMFFIRTIYYKIMKIISEVEHLDHFHGFGLYDKKFINEMKNLNDPQPYLRGIVSEIGYKKILYEYSQEKRKRGKSSFNFLRLYEVSMLGFTSYSKIIMRMATFLGITVAIISIIVAIVTLIIKLTNWDAFPMGAAATSIGVYFLGAIQLFFIGILGEYIMGINTRVINRPLVIEEERINFK